MQAQAFSTRGLTLAGWIYLVIGYGLLMLPIFTLVVFSFESSRFPTLPWTGWTWSWYRQLWQDGTLIQALRASLLVSPLAAAIATMLGFFGAYALNRFEFRGKQPLTILLIVPILVPPLILGVAFLGWLSRFNLQGQLHSILIAHVVILLPTAIALISLRLMQMPRSLEQAAWNLGATEWQALWRVVLPWAMPGIAGGFLLAFTFSFDEFVIAWFVSGFAPTLPVAIYNFLGSNLSPSLNAIGTIVFLFSLVLLVGVELLLIPMLVSTPTKAP
jgi:spermidine/putrescine transport system permease protein